MGTRSFMRRMQRNRREHRALTPHSPAWFSALARDEPVKARMTLDLLELAGRFDVCSVCGDEPAPIHDPVNPGLPPLRLCRDCLQLRAVMHGEHYRLRPDRHDRAS